MLLILQSHCSMQRSLAVGTTDRRITDSDSSSGNDVDEMVQRQSTRTQAAASFDGSPDESVPVARRPPDEPAVWSRGLPLAAAASYSFSSSETSESDDSDSDLSDDNSVSDDEPAAAERWLLLPCPSVCCPREARL